MVRAFSVIVVVLRRVCVGQGRAARATAWAVSSVIPAKSPALTRSRGTIQEPPTAATAGMLRYSCRFFGPMPPVGTKLTPPKGAARAAIAALAAPFGGVSFVPTGGIGPKNLHEYLSIPAVAAVGGSWMVPRDRVKAGDFAGITELTAQAVALAARP